MISKTKAKLDPSDDKDTELLTFNESALIFVIINAIKELSEKVDKLSK